MKNSQLQDLMKKKMSRKQFLVMSSLTIAASFGIIGVLRQLLSNAATPAASFEGEAGSETSPATEVTDASASAGKAIKFGTSTTQPPVTGWTPLYSTEFQNLTGWSVRDEAQNNDNSRNIAANVVPASVAGGKGLKIYGKRQSGYAVPYTSGEIHGTGTGLIVPNYFRAEVIGTSMDVSGLWPCLLWFRPQNANDGEIDVMEYMGGRSENLTRKRIAVTMHNEYGATQDSIKKPIYFDQLSNPSVTAKHKYVLEKRPGSIKVIIDDEVTSTFTAADKAWWNRIMEVQGRTWYPRITLQIGSGSATSVVPNPPASWTQSEMTVDSLKFWVPA
ncbi:MAG TPA: family 16 glycosylhydrolase [Candidatus Saccharimonadales bacterium]|jgi:hypothetical protein